MRNGALAAAAVAAAIVAGDAGHGQSDRFPATPLRPDPGPTRLNYDSFRYDSGQGQIEIIVPRRDRPPPLVIWLTGADHGREARNYSTEWLPHLLFDNGFALAIIETSPPRRIRAAGVLEETITAIKVLAEQADERGYDMSRVILMGRGSGGQVAALLATDPLRLTAAGVAPEAVRAALIINGDAFDLAERIESSSSYRRSQYVRAFGSNPEIWADMSPAAHAAAPNAPRLLLYAAEGLGDYVVQAEAFAELLRSHGTSVHVEQVPRSLDTLPTMLGARQNPHTRSLLDRLLEAVEPQQAAR